jgi:hypothetical protein
MAFVRVDWYIFFNLFHRWENNIIPPINLIQQQRIIVELLLEFFYEAIHKVNSSKIRIDF